MKRKLFLQLFTEAGDGGNAGDGANGADGGNTGEGNNAGEGASGGKEGAKYTDDDVNAIIDKKFAEWQKKQEKAVKEAQKLANMNAQQKAEHERDELQKRIDEYEKKETLSEMSKTARKMLSDSHINVSDELLSMMVSTDAEDTKQAVDSFVKAFNEAVENAVKERLKGEPPKKGGTAKVTKEQIFAIKNPAERQRMIAENIELFN